MVKGAAMVLLACVLVCAAATASRAQTPPPILDGNIGTITELDVSPDGQRLAWIGEQGDHRDVTVREVMSAQARTLPVVARVRQLHWAGDNRHIYVLADQAGDEQHHVLIYDTVDPALAPRDLTPYPGKKAMIVDTNNPDGSALVEINLSNPERFDLYRVSSAPGAPKLVQTGAPRQIGWLTTTKGEVFGRIVMDESGGPVVETKSPGHKAWRRFAMSSGRMRLGDAITAASEPLPDGSLWLLARGALDTAIPQRVDLATGKMLESIPPDVADTELVVFDVDHRPLLTQSIPGYPLLRIFDPALRDLLRTVPLPIHSFLKATAYDLTMSRLVMHFAANSGEESLVYVDRRQKLTQILFRRASPLLPEQSPKTVAVDFLARDKLPLHGYLTIPPNRAATNLPLVLVVHGGPWIRDTWTFDWAVNGLALQGYAVLRVNFRGSGGYGRAFEDAGIGEWGGKMQDDLTDAACWAIGQGVADSSRMAIMGASYGGYAALMALVRTPKMFVGAVDENGPVDLPAHLSEEQPYVRKFLPIATAFIGADPQVQWDRSPLAHIDQIERPVLAFHGDNDPRVQVSQLRRFEAAMRAAGKDITASYYADEGHGLATQTNYVDYLGKVFEFMKTRMASPGDAAEAKSYCRN